MRIIGNMGWFNRMGPFSGFTVIFRAAVQSRAARSFCLAEIIRKSFP